MMTQLGKHSPHFRQIKLASASVRARTVEEASTRRRRRRNSLLKKIISKQKMERKPHTAGCQVTWKYYIICSTSLSSSFSILTLIQHYPIGRKNFFLITFNWLANALVYNGLSYYSANLNVSSHLGFFIR